MTELMPFLKELIALPGLSGHEEPIRLAIAQAWTLLADELEVSRLGSLHGLRRGAWSAAPPAPRLLLAAHMDAIGLMVTGIVDGFLRITNIGGVDGRVLPGQLVTVHGRQDCPAVVVQPAAHLLPADVREKTVPLEYLWVDTGLLPGEVERLVRIGDLVSFAQPPLAMNGEILAGHSLDNRASVAAVTACLQELRNRPLVWDVWAVATSQEEVTLGGARTSAFSIRPTLAVVIDVTFGAGPGSPAHKTFPIGKGVVLGVGPSVHPALVKTFQALADRLEIPYKIEPMPRSSGTDADAVQVAAEGIPTMVVSIPLRYMHTPVEMVSIKDIQRTGRLLAEFAASLDEQFMDKLQFEP